MNYTQNHHLPQWAKSDRILMDDFNDAMANIESGMNANAQAAASAQSTASSAASDAANALAKANAAQSAASSAYSPSNKPYVVGSYTGGTGFTHVRLSFWPSFLIISGMKPTRSGAATDFSPFDRYFVMVSGTQMNDRVQLHNLGFSVYPRPTNDAYYPDLNEPGRTYDYIAFK